MSDDLDLRRRRAVYRAQHRGTKEMDWLLGRYAAAKLPAMGSDALDHFERLIAVSDTDLHAWIVEPQYLTGREFEPDIADIRRFHDL